MTLLHAVSFDVEEHFQVANYAAVVPRDGWDSHPSRVEANVDKILTLLRAAKTRATFFTLGWIAERHGGLIREIVRQGHEIASHGYDHQFVDRLGERGFRDDVKRTKAILEEAGGTRVLGFRASTFTITERTPWALDILADEGYAYDASIFPVHHPTYGIPHAPRTLRVETLRSGRTLVEFPPLTLRLFGKNLAAGGGGYFRLFPFAYTRQAFANAETEGSPGSLYLHPWEFDPEQPRFPVGVLRNFRQHYNVGRTAERLTRLLSEFRFGSMEDAIRTHLGPTSLPGRSTP
jgi:polysaccharide deacetylase family protein (PEP-CTERM system associated)